MNGSFGAVWGFLRDEQNREALGVLGTALAAISVAGWAVFLEIRSRRRVAELARKIEEIERLQNDLLRRLDHTDRNHDILVGALTLSSGVVTFDRVGRGIGPMVPGEESEK